MSRLAACLMVASSALLCVRQGMGSDYTERLSLTGLRGIAVNVIVPDQQQAFKRLVSVDTLRAQIESKLRQAGIHVMDEQELNKDVRLPTLDVRLNAVRWSRQGRGEPLGYSVSVQVAVNQALWVVEKDTPTTPVCGDTWSKDYVVNYRREALRKGALNGLIGHTTDQFVKDYWLAAHDE